ncbi:amidohydrolase family protein [Cohnella caldifontis]|uniref:amidohydrolase family protein n=1 Tax=Cohnella caldifontis TaxID=3027471 RepID=UPI0023EB9D70|nr:amidohydrolase family protein [Cohnella sp. YIM B05605]
MTTYRNRARKTKLYPFIILFVLMLAAVGVWAGTTLFGDGKEASPPSASSTGTAAGSSAPGQSDKPSPTMEGEGASLPPSPSPDADQATGIDQPTAAELAATYDVVIQGGRVINPETKLDRTGLNVAIQGGTIALVTDKPVKGKKVIDATGLVVSPGFIDNLSYDPNPLGVWNKIADGVTTNIAMHGGTSTPEKWYPYYVKNRPPVNFGASFFYTQARNQFKLSRYATASPDQTAKLVTQAEKALNNGALGISFSLEYVPGIGDKEILPLMELAQKYNVPVYFHGRYSDMEEPGTNFDTINEIVGYARASGAAVHIDHINSTGGTFSMVQSLGMIDDARAEGLDVTSCIYPYDYWGTYLNSARFDTGWQQRFRITYKDLQIAGTNERLTAETFKQYQKQGKLAVAYAIPKQDVVDSLKAPYVMIGSDAILEPGFNNHPRASGTFARTIGMYVRDQQVISLMDAIDKMSLMPAQRLEKQTPALKKKGRIAKGMDADIVVFDYDTIKDMSTVEKPNLLSAGIKYVLVGGQTALDGQGLHKNVRVGQPIKSEFLRVAKSQSNLTWEGTSMPLLAYRDALYVDLEALKAHGYSYQWDKVAHAYALQTGATAEKANVPAPKVGELMLERGYLLKWDGGQSELLSVGDRAYVSLDTLAQLGWKLTKTAGGYTLDPK